MPKKITPAQLRSMANRANREYRQAVQKANREINREIKKAEKKAVAEYNRDVRAHNAAVSAGKCYGQGVESGTLSLR